MPRASPPEELLQSGGKAGLAHPKGAAGLDADDRRCDALGQVRKTGWDSDRLYDRNAAIRTPKGVSLRRIANCDVVVSAKEVERVSALRSDRGAAVDRITLWVDDAEKTDDREQCCDE